MARSDTKTSEAKTSVSVMDVDMNELAREILELFQQTAVPEEAQTRHEIAAELEGKLETWQVKAFITQKIKSGEWTKKRVGNIWYYWKAGDT